MKHSCSFVFVLFLFFQGKWYIFANKNIKLNFLGFPYAHFRQMNYFCTSRYLSAQFDWFQLETVQPYKNGLISQ